MTLDRYRTGVDSLRSRPALARTYNRVLVEVARAQQDKGIFDEPVAHLLEQAQAPTLEAWKAWEARYRHETAGFVQAQRELIRYPRSRDLVYLGMTSSNLQDCADALVWDQAHKQIRDTAIDCAEVALFVEGQWQDRDGRTHGRLAQPVPAHRMYQRFRRDLYRDTRRLQSDALWGSLGGPVGTGNQALTEDVVSLVEDRLEVPIDLLATQTSSRHQLAVVATNLVHLIGTCEQLATHHRLESISGVDGFAEGFAEGQRGSSVMPHKRNPIRSERICGLARVARGHLQAILETANTQWWERDLTNSSVERTAFWDLVSLTLFILTETTRILESGRVTLPEPPELVEEPTADELVRRVLQGESHSAVYTEIQERHNA